MRRIIDDGNLLAGIHHLDEEIVGIVAVGHFAVQFGKLHAVFLRAFRLGIEREFHRLKVLVPTNINRFGEDLVVFFKNLQHGLVPGEVRSGHLDFYGEIVAEECLCVVDDAGDAQVGLHDGVAGHHGIDGEFQPVHLILGIAAGIVDTV